MPSEIGSATFGLVVGLGKFKKDLAKGESDAGQAGKEIGAELTDSAAEEVEKGSGKITAAVTAAGAAAAAGLGLAFAESLDINAGVDKMAAGLDLSEAEAKRAGDVAGKVYAGAWGESIEEVQGATSAVLSTLGEFAQTDKDLERLTTRGLDFANVFDQDLARSIANAGVLIETGLAKDADHAFDLMVSSMQKVPVAVRDELADATHEYSQFFAGLGIDGEQAMGMLVEASKGGTFMIDKVGDSLKELRIRAADGSTATTEAFEAIGLNGERMATKIETGGDAANDAFRQIVNGLLAIEDPAERSRTAIALFGTPFEDISGDASKTDQLLRSLASGGLTEVEGSAQRMSDTLNDNAKTSLTEWQRKVEMGVVGAVNDKLLPALAGLPGPLSTVSMGFLGAGAAGAGVASEFGTAALALRGMGPNLTSIGSKATSVVGSMRTMSATAVTTGAETAAAWATSAKAAATAKAATLKSLALQGAKWIWMGIQSMIGAAQVAAAWLLSIWPIALIIAAVVGLVALIVIHWDTIKSVIEAALGAIVGFVQGAISWLGENWPLVLAILTGPIGLAVLAIARNWDTIKKGAAAAKDWIVDKFTALVSFVVGLPGRLARAGADMFKFIQTSFRDAVNWVIRGWNRLEFKVPGFDPPGPGPSFGGFTLGLPNIPELALGGTVTMGGAAIVGDDGVELLELPTGARVTPLDATGGVGTAGGREVIQLILDGRVVTEVVRDRLDDIDRRNGRRRGLPRAGVR